MAEQPISKSKTVSNELAAKLQKRPNPQEVGVSITLSPSLAATVKKLETEQKKDIVDKTLKNRPTASEVGVDTTIAPSIQPTVKTLTNKIRRDSLKQSLQTRPEIEELIDSGVLKPYSQTLANSLQVDAAKLETALASQVSKEYLQQIGVLNPYKKNVDDSSIIDNIEEASGLLLRALVYRKSYGTVVKEAGSGTQFGFNSNIAPGLQNKAKHLDIQQKKDKLSSALENRPSPRGVMNKQVQQMGYDTNVAPSLQQTIKDLGKEMIKDTLNTLLNSNIKSRKRSSSINYDKLAPGLQNVANKLAMEQKKNTLSSSIRSRSDAQELIDKGILKPYANSLANRLQLNADMLEKQLAMRVDEDYLKGIGILEPYKHNVDTSSIDDEQIRNKANLLLKSLIIKQRKRRESGGDKSELIAPSLQATAKKLELKQTKDILKKKLETNRPNKKDIKDITHIDDSVADSLQATKKKLEKEMVKDTINKTLLTRHEPVSEVCNISPAIQSIAKQLQSKIRRNSLSEKLTARPNIEELIDTRILKPYTQSLANSLQVDANKLEQALAQRVSKEYLQQIGILDPYKKNVDDTKIDVEKASGLLLRALIKKQSVAINIKGQTTAFGFADIAPSIQQTAHTLDVQQKKDKLSAALENRPTPRGLMEKQAGQLGYDVQAAPSLQQTIKELGKEMLKDYLGKALRERPDPQTIGHGVDVKNAPAIQGAMHDLQSAQRRDSVSKGMRDRKSVKEVGVDTQLARGLQSIAKTLEMEMKQDTVKHKLSDLGIIKKTNTESVLAKLDQCIQFLGSYKL